MENSMNVETIRTIKINRPKLAICIYHGHEDMLRLIELVNG